MVWLLWVLFEYPHLTPYLNHTLRFDSPFIYRVNHTNHSNHTPIEGSLEVERGENGLEAKHSIEFGMGTMVRLWVPLSRLQAISRNSTPILEYPHAR